MDGRAAWCGDRRWLTLGAATRPRRTWRPSVTRPVVTPLGVTQGAATRDAATLGRGGLRAVESRRAASRSPRSSALEQGGFANVDVPARLGKTQLSDRDRAWVTGAVYGTLRRQRYLDDLIRAALQADTRRARTGGAAALRLGAYQLVDGVAPHAAVGETVGAAPKRARTYVNGVLRSLDRHGRPWPEPTGLGQRLSYPDWIVDELVTGFGEADGRAGTRSDERTGRRHLAGQPAARRPHRGVARARAAGASTTPGTLLPDAIVVVGTGDLERLRSVREGRVTPQDQASQAVVSALDPQAGSACSTSPRRRAVRRARSPSAWATTAW